ncbi:corticospinal neuron axon guidance through spinal cord [Branchiostoma belcheri]|nr:corticospinal neuron axon guidance through spinal cord [Branchiostoma belcheri]
MGRKLRHMLMLLLIILREPNMPEATCSCPSPICRCPNLGLSSVPQTLPTSITLLELSNNSFGLLPSISFVKLEENPWQCDCKMVPFRLNITKFPSFKDQIKCAEPIELQNKKLIDVNPEEMRTKNTPLGLKPNVVASNNTTYIVTTSGVQKGQGQHQANTQSLKIEDPSQNQILAALQSVEMYAGEGTPQKDPKSTDMVSCDRQARQGQPQAITESITNTTVSVMASDDDHQDDDFDSHRFEIGQGQPQSNTESNINNTTTKMASDDHHQYEDVDKHCFKTGLSNTESNKNNTTTVMNSTSGDDHTRQGQSQTITKFLDARNQCYGTGPTAPQLNSLYTTDTAVISGREHTGQDQSTIKSLDARNQSYGSVPTDSQLNSLYTTGTAMSQTIAEPNTNTTATVMTSGDDQTGQGQSEPITESNTNTAATVMTSGHDQTGQGQP